MRGQTGTFSAIFLLFMIVALSGGQASGSDTTAGEHEYAGFYSGRHLDRIAFPIGGMGAGMVCLEGTGGLMHVSVRHTMQFFNEPCMFAALCVKGDRNVAKVLEGPISDWKVFGQPRTGNGAPGSDYGLPRFDSASFIALFPFGTVRLEDDEIPLEVAINGWSPFIPGDADNSSLPVGALEYTFKNPTRAPVEAVFYFNTKKFISIKNIQWHGGLQYGEESVLPVKNGFMLHENGTDDNPEYEGSIAFFVDSDDVTVNHCWFRGGWWDSLTMAWKDIENGTLHDTPPSGTDSPGASLAVPLRLAPGEARTIRLMMAWYVPNTALRFGADPEDTSQESGDATACCVPQHYTPWYATRFKNIGEVIGYWRGNYDSLRERTALFTDTFYDSTLPPEVIEAVAANLTILKSPTVLRERTGKLWCFEGCTDNTGCCPGSCTHVWNYAQAICHLFPGLERSLRDTEFNISQNGEGHQTFRASLPLRPVVHTFHAASDGQLGGIMKVYREWRIYGDTNWLEALWPKVRQSLDYCIRTWDPRGRGVLEEPHHNTYDIEFWGPDGMCTSFYLGALKAAVEMGSALGENVSHYSDLLHKGTAYLENELYDGEYFYQKVTWEGLDADDPVAASKVGINMNYSEEAVELLRKEGPKYQYGTGCISDGVLGFWIARMCGLGNIADETKVKSNLAAIYKYNLKRDLYDHVNPQRPAYAMNHDGGLLLCTWPKGGMPSLPFVYSNEVWTGIEYQVASHLMLEGMVDEGLDIVRVCRDRYDGRVRNPFNEYECGHWYARAMASYGLLEGLTGVRYDAVDKILYVDSRVGDFRSFLSTATGYGSVGLKAGKPFLDVKEGEIDVRKVIISGKESKLM